MGYPTRVRSAHIAGASLLALAGLMLSGCGAGTSLGGAAAGSATQVVKGVPSAPTLGYVFTSKDGTLRPILGVSGSSQVGTSIVPAGVYVAGEASVSGNTGLLEDVSGSLFSFDLPLSQPIHVADNLPAGAKISFASNGLSAVVFAPGGSAITLVTGLPAKPVVKTLSVASGSALVAAVVSDAGVVAIGTATAVGTLSPAGQFSRIATVGAMGGLSFMPGSDDLLLTDASANTLSLLRSVSGNVSAQTFQVAGLNQPLLVAGSRDKRWAVVANGGDNAVLRIDLVSGTATARLTCACQASQLTALAGGNAFRLNDVGNGPTWTFNTAGASPQLLFVPAIQ